jgi:hypothetical protein
VKDARVTPGINPYKGPKGHSEKNAMKIASQAVAVRIHGDNENHVALFLNNGLIMSRKEEDGPAREIMREVAENLEVFTGRPIIMAEFKKTGAPWTWDEVIASIRDTHNIGRNDADSMLVSVDGGETYSKAVEGVRIIYPNRIHYDNDVAELQINATMEGLVCDLWVGPNCDAINAHAGSATYDLDDIVPLN